MYTTDDCAAVAGRLTGRDVVQVCVGVYESMIALAPDAVVRFADNVLFNGMECSPRGAHVLHVLLGRRIVRAEECGGGGLGLWFDDGSALVLRRSESVTEPFTVNVDGKFAYAG